MARRTRRKSTRRKRSSRRSEGGGWSLDPSKFVSAGNLVNSQYTGVGKDCAGSVVRPGFITNYNASGMPGMKGGKRSRKSRGGYRLDVAPIIPPPSYFPDTTGAGGTVGAPGVPNHVQKGGRYEVSPGPLLSNGSDIGMKGIANHPSIGCERGTLNSLNPNPGGVQSITTAPMRGGAQTMSPAPTVAVGAADSMRYNAPTAGYRPEFQTFPGTSAVGGLMLNTPYDARAYNQACLKTGGGSGVADGAASYSTLQMGQVTGRGDFDGSNGLLPMKYGGKRSTRKRSTRRKHRKHRKH